MSAFNAKDLASRVQGLLQARFKGDVVVAARALGVDHEALRAIVEDETEHPRIDLLAAVVRYFGVDACWLVTGEYDWRAHMNVLEDEEEDPSREPRQLLLRLTTRRRDEIARPLEHDALDAVWNRPLLDRRNAARLESASDSAS